MSQKQKTRSALTINAVAAGAAALAPKVAATGAAVLNPLNKLAAIAGLAGLVLRLFRSKEPLPSANRSPVRILYGSCKAAGQERGGKKGGLTHG